MARRKDTSNSLPLDQYRKKIGRQENKKSKVELKEIKEKSQAKKTFGSNVKEILIMVLSSVFLMSLVYLFLYWSLKKEEAAVEELLSGQE